MTDMLTPKTCVCQTMDGHLLEGERVCVRACAANSLKVIFKDLVVLIA